jgi:anaerobic selenocysteine-containing dehydrogenase
MTSYGSYAVQLAEPVIAPIGESLPNAEVFRRLALRLGIDPGPQGDALLGLALQAIEGPLAASAGRLEQLRRELVLRFAFPAPSDAGARPSERPVQFASTFPGTPDARIQLWPKELGPQPYAYLEPPDQSYPLALISPGTERSICSTLAEYSLRETFVELHPADAGSRGLGDGQEVRIHNALGEVQVRLRISERLRPGVAYLPKGLWRRHTRNGLVGAALVTDDVSPLSGGACFNDARVEVSPA